MVDTTGSVTIVMIAVLLMLIFIVIRSLIELRKTRYLLKHGVHVIGSIIGAVREKDIDGPDKYKLIIEFDTMDGATFSFSPQIRASEPPRIGKKVDVIYDKMNPNRVIQFTRYTYLNFWLGFLMVFLLTIVATICFSRIL